MLGDVAAELRHLDVGPELTLETGEEHLALRRLEAVDDRRDRTHQIRSGEQDELLVDEVIVTNVVARHVQVGAGLVGVEPRLAVLDALLGEGHVDEVTVAVGGPQAGLLVVVQLGKVLFRFLGGGGTETLVVLDVPAASGAGLLGRFFPVVVLGEGVEHLAVLALGRLDDRGDELHEEAGDLEQRREVRVKKVDE